MRKLMREHATCIALIAALLVANIGCLAAFIQYNAEYPRDVSLIGSYYTSPTPHFATYLVFGHEEDFYVYKQLEPPIARGSYRQDGQYITLTTDEGSCQLLLKGKHVYAFDPESGMIVQFEKFTNVPTFISVDFE